MKWPLEFLTPDMAKKIAEMPDQGLLGMIMENDTDPLEIAKAAENIAHNIRMALTRTGFSIDKQRIIDAIRQTSNQ